MIQANGNHSKDGKMQVGGQAVIEGVMMRSPQRVAVAVRRPDGQIMLKTDSFQSWTKRYKILGLPIFRGGVVLIESLVLGVRALTYSGDVAMEAENGKGKGDDRPEKNTKKSRWATLRLALTVVFALVLGLLIFFYVPLILTGLLQVKSGVWFNLVDGVIRLAIFLAYLFLNTLWSEIRRIFQYHGAEHKSIFAFENGKELSLAGVRPFSTQHPRCGTSFLLIVMMVSIVVFVFLGRPDNISERLLRLAFVPLIGGISYELIKLSERGYGSSFGRLLIAPGLWLQKITTKEPDDRQLEVALIALRGALGENLRGTAGVVLDEGVPLADDVQTELA